MARPVWLTAPLDLDAWDKAGHRGVSWGLEAFCAVVPWALGLAWVVAFSTFRLPSLEPCTLAATLTITLD